MLSQQRFSPERLPQDLEIGDIVDWLGQDCLVIGISKRSEKPVRIKNLVAGDFQSVGFDEINDILIKNTLGECNPLLRYVQVARAIFSDKLKAVGF